MPKAAPPVGTIGHAIKAKRGKLGITQRVAAQQMTDVGAVEVSQANLVRWEKGQSEPEAKFYGALFPWLGVGETEAARLVLRTRMALADINLESAKAWKAAASKASPVGT